MRTTLRGMAVGAGVLVALVVAVGGYRQYLVHELRKPVLAQLSDPSSAQFQNERVFSDWTPGGSALCGEVNSKNRMGGYAGFKTFKSLPGLAQISNPDNDRLKVQLGLEPCPFKNAGPWWHLSW